MNETSTNEIIKSDARGRTRYSEDYKQEVVAAFEKSGQSGIQFAKQCGPTARYHRSLGQIPRTREPPQVHGIGKIGRLSRSEAETAGGNACFT